MDIRHDGQPTIAKSKRVKAATVQEVTDLIATLLGL